MALVKNLKNIYAHALENEYMLGAYNIYNIETMQGVAEISEKYHAPAILQIGPWTRGHIAPLGKFVRYMKDYLADFETPFIIHHDHCQSVQMAKEAVDAGFMAVMYDGSALPLEENIRNTKEVAAYAHARGVWVEAELGKIPGFEHNIFEANMVFTEPKTAKRFASETGCDSLAVAVGTAHGGVEADAPLKIDFALLSEIKQEVGDFPLVLHGAASLPFPLIDQCNALGGNVAYLRMCEESCIEKSRHFGVTKVNMDVDNWLVCCAHIRRFMQEHPNEFSPIPIDDLIKKGYMEEVEHKILNVTMSKGMAKKFLNE